VGFLGEGEWEVDFALVAVTPDEADPLREAPALA